MIVNAGLRLVVTAVLAYFCGPAAAACVAGLNAAFTLASGGSLLQAAIVAAVSYATYSISAASSEAASASATQTGLADGIVATTADASAQATTQTATEGILQAASDSIAAASIVERATMGNSKAENASNTSAAKKTVTASSGMNNARLKRSGGNKRNEIYSHRGGNLADNVGDLNVDQAKVVGLTIEERHKALEKRIVNFAFENPGKVIRLSKNSLNVILEYESTRPLKGNYLYNFETADTFIYRKILTGRDFLVQGYGLVEGGNLNYIGVGIMSARYNLPAPIAVFQINAWNIYQFLDDQGDHNLRQLNQDIHYWAGVGNRHYRTR